MLLLCFMETRAWVDVAGRKEQFCDGSLHHFFFFIIIHFLSPSVSLSFPEILITTFSRGFVKRLCSLIHRQWERERERARRVQIQIQIQNTLFHLLQWLFLFNKKEIL